MLVYNPRTGRTTSFDGREMAPASATPTMFLDANGQPRATKADAIPGGLSVGIPGVVKMLALAHMEIRQAALGQIVRARHQAGR